MSAAVGAQEASRLPNIVSVDDHIVEPPQLWQQRLPAHYREVGPRIVRETVGRGGAPTTPDDPDARPADVWYFEDVRFPMLRIYSSVGLDPSEIDAIGQTYDEMRPGCYDPRAYLADMDMNGVDASLGFPNLFLRFCGQRFLEAKDKDLALACLRVYNDWLADEWEAKGEGRLFGARLVPLWDPELAAEEVHRTAEQGARAVCFSELPAWLGLPSLHSGEWDPFFAACNETGMVVTMHIGSSSNAQSSSDDAPPSLRVINLYTNSSLSLSDYLLSGLFVRYPNLSISYAEAQAGWIPYLIQRLDEYWHDGTLYMEVASRLPEPPSHYYYRHVYSCVFDDSIALQRLLDLVGEDNVCFETDYPHTDGTWPESKQVLARQVEGLSREQAEKLARGNAMRMLGMDSTIPNRG